WVDIEVNGKQKRIGITRIHLEEDAGKLTHGDDGYSLVDFNRQGSPLIEIVSEPDISSPAEAYAYLDKLKNIVQYTGVSECRMEQGSLRCDANISIRPIGQEAFGTKTELKNLNSFHYVEKGLEFEEKRQEKVLLSGGEIEQETRRYDEKTSETILMRVKDDADVLTSSKQMADFVETTADAGSDKKLAANWLMGDLSAYMNKHLKELDELPITPEGLAKMVQLIEDGTISSKIAKKVFAELVENGGDPEKIVKDKGLVQISDEGQLKEIISEVLDNNEQSVTDYKGGKGKALGFLVGQVMKATKGQANPPMVNKILKEELDNR